MQTKQNVTVGVEGAMLQYTALIVDIKNSKKYEGSIREELQRHIYGSLEYLNSLFVQGIEKPVVFSGGDEVQGLFRDSVTAFLYYRFLNMLLNPITIRGGIGVGDWRVKLEKAESTAQDGPVYHCAREAISQAKSSRYYDLFFSSRRSSDESVTVLMDYPLGVGKMRTTKQNEFALIVEMLLPLVRTGNPNRESQGTIQGNQVDMLESLCRFRRATYQKNNKPSLYEKVVEGGAAERFRWSFDAAAALDEWVSSDRGLVSKQVEIAHVPTETLVELLGMTKQGVNRQIVESRVVQERNSVAFVFWFMKEMTA